MDKVSKNPRMLAALGDPRMTPLLEEMQTNPTSAMKKLNVRCRALQFAMARDFHGVRFCSLWPQGVILLCCCSFTVLSTITRLVGACHSD